MAMNPWKAGILRNIAMVAVGVAILPCCGEDEPTARTNGGDNGERTDTAYECDEGNSEVVDGRDNNCDGCVDEPIWSYLFRENSGVEYLDVLLFDTPTTEMRFGFYHDDGWSGEACTAWEGECHSMSNRDITLEVVDEQEEVVLGESTLFGYELAYDSSMVFWSSEEACFSLNDDRQHYEATGCCSIDGMY